MEREILFRGRAVDSGEWIFGDLMYYAGGAQIWRQINDRKWNCIVDPATVGQYTGLADKNGVKIFEEDIIFGEGLGTKKEHFVIRWDAAICSFYAGEGKRLWPCLNQRTVSGYVVVGNVHDTPELWR